MTQPWRLVVIDEADRAFPFSPVVAEAVSEAVAEGHQPPTVLLRYQRPYVLLGPADLRLPHIDKGLSWLEQHRLPVFVRISGGGAVLLDETCLSFSVSIPCRDLTMLRSNYERLAVGVIHGLRRLGITAGFAEVDRTFCPGPYDLAAGGRKIVGISQALRRGFAEVGGMILVSQDPVRATRLLEGFYAAAGNPRSFDPDHHTNVHLLCKRPVPMEEVLDVIIQGYSEHFPLKKGELSAAELARAERLYVERSLTS